MERMAQASDDRSLLGYLGPIKLPNNSVAAAATAKVKTIIASVHPIARSVITQLFFSFSQFGFLIGIGVPSNVTWRYCYILFPRRV